MSLGDLVSGSGNTLNQISQLMRPPNPAPNPNPGAAAPGGAPQTQQQQPSTAPASPPDMGQMYIKLMQQDRAAHMFDTGLAGMQAAFAPPGQQAAWLGSAPPEQDAGAQIGNLMKIQAAQQAQQEHLAAAAGAESSFRALFPDAKPGVGTELFNLGKLPEVLSTHMAGMNPTEAMKNADAAVKAYADGNHDATPEQLAQLRSNLLSNAMGGDLDQRQYFNAVNSGAFKGTYAEWKNQNAAEGKQISDYAQAKADAKETFPSLDKAYGTAEATIERLNANPEATTAAIHLGPMNSKVLQGLVASGAIKKETADARGDLDQLGSENFRAGLTDVKNVRSQSEANKISGSITALDNSQNSDEKIMDELGRLQDISQAARGNLTAAAGKSVPGKYTGLVDSSYLDPKSPLYNGASQEAGNQIEEVSLAKTRELLKDHPEQRSRLIRHFRTLGYDTSKL